MATMTFNTDSMLDSFFPKFGQQRADLPVWNEGDRMFISDEYESEAGNRYYKGVRFSDRLAIVEKVGLYHNWKYIDEIEMYVFNGREKVLVNNRKFEKVFYSAALIKDEAYRMAEGYLKSQLKLNRIYSASGNVSEDARVLVDQTYVSLMSDNYDMGNLRQMLPLLQSDC